MGGETRRNQSIAELGESDALIMTAPAASHIPLILDGFMLVTISRVLSNSVKIFSMASKYGVIAE